MKTGTAKRGSKAESDQTAADDQDIEIGFGKVLCGGGQSCLYMLKK